MSALLLRLALRRLRRSPAFTVAAVLTVAIGIGAASAVFAVVDGVLVRPLPYPGANRLAGAWLSMPKIHFPRVPQSFATYVAFKKFAKTIDGIAVVDRLEVNLADSAGNGPPRRLTAAQVTAEFFPLIGAPLVLGRAFTATDGGPRASPAAIISDGLWRSQFGADPRIVGKPAYVDGQRREIVGVLAPSFHFPDEKTEIWLPSTFDPASPFPGFFLHPTFVRLRAGATMAAAQREMDALIPRAAELYPSLAPGLETKALLAQAGTAALLHPMRDDIVGPFAPVVWIALAAGALILVVAATNVASLILTRAEERGREIAVCVALGASRIRILEQSVSEAGLVAGFGGVLGLVLARVAIDAFRRYGPTDVPRLSEIAVDSRVTLFALATTAGVAVLCAVLPVLRHRHRVVARSIQDGARGGTSGRERQRARRALVVAQVAFAVVLVSGAGLLLQSAQRLRGVRPGFDADSTLTLWMSLPEATYPHSADVMRFTAQVRDRIAALPGVRVVGVTSKIPLAISGRGYAPIYTDDAAMAPNTLPPAEQVVSTSGEYFAAMRIPLIAGRTFDRLERQPSRETIIDQGLAMRYWHDSTGTRALGRRVRILPSGPWYTVIGVVGAVHDTSLAAPANGVVYVPDVVDPDSNNTNASRTVALVVRTSVEPRLLVRPIEGAIAGMDRALPLFDVQRLNDLVRLSMARLDFVMLLLCVSAFVALTVATIGLYGVIALVVSLRTREIGIRLALGAPPSLVAREVTFQGIALGGMGVVAGIAAFVLAARLLENRLSGVAPVNAGVVSVVAATLLAVAVGASWLPARRASAVDPLSALNAG